MASISHLTPLSLNLSGVAISIPSQLAFATKKDQNQVILKMPFICRRSDEKHFGCLPGLHQQHSKSGRCPETANICSYFRGSQCFPHLFATPVHLSIFVYGWTDRLKLMALSCLGCSVLKGRKRMAELVAAADGECWGLSVKLSQENWSKGGFFKASCLLQIPNKVTQNSQIHTETLDANFQLHS